MSKMENLSVLEEEIFKFLRNSFHLNKRELPAAFEQLLLRIRKLEENRFETRAFVYLDIISWLESKIKNMPVQAIIQEKFKKRALTKNNKKQKSS